MRYVVDIDGTICTPGPTEEMRYEQAMPIQDRIDKINKLYDEGHTIVYLTARGMVDTIILWTWQSKNSMNLQRYN